MSQKTNNHWDVLYALAEKSAACNEVPVAALLVQNNRIIVSAHNLVETHNDPTSHAEMLVLREGFKLLGKHLTDCDVYVSLEPCPMCAHAIKLSRVRRLYFGAYDPKGGGVEHGPKCLEGLDRLEIFGGFHEAQFNILLKAFFKPRRI